MISNTAVRKVKSWEHNGDRFKLVLSCGHYCYKRAAKRDVPKTGKCPRWPDECDITARPIETVVALGDLGPVLEDS